MDKDDFFEKVYQAALTILDYSAQSEKKISEKLLKKEFPEETVLKVIEKLKSLNLINDKEYCRNAVNALISNKNCGEKKISVKMIRKGISRDIIKEAYSAAMENFQNEDEIIIKFINKKGKAIKRLYEKNDIKKIQYKLYSEGFSSAAIRRVMKELSSIMENL